MTCLLAVLLACVFQDVPPQDPAAPAAPPSPAPAAPVQPAAPAEPRGLKRREADAFPGYTLIAPLRSKDIYLVDLDGRVVHKWATKYEPGSEYFLPNGNLLRCSREPNAPRFQAGGQCGRMQEIAWDGTVVWDWKYSTDEYLQHHDLTITPDGTILFIAWQYKSKADAVTAGRHPAHLSADGMWSDSVIEIEPVRPDGAEIVWEWHVWDHLVQDLDPDAENHGNVAEHPELLDVNADLRADPPSDAQLADMQALGYIAAMPTQGQRNADWLHLNAIAYHPGLDQILLSSPELCEIFVIDHSTTSDEATGHEGGSAGKGGDFLWRWGNPRNHGAGTSANRRLFYQHNARWIPDGFPGAGNVLVFNNGGGRPDGDWTSVLELKPPLNADGTYVLEPFLAAGPADPDWVYTAPDPKSFFASFISGAQRLPNGNTLICSGPQGRVFEVTPDRRVVWDFLSPLGDTTPSPTAGPVPPHALFRATRIPLDHPGLRGKQLRPLQ